MRRTAIFFAAGLTLFGLSGGAVLHYAANWRDAAGLERLLMRSDGLHIGHIAISPWQSSMRLDDLAWHEPGLSLSIAHLTYRPAARPAGFVTPAFAEGGGSAQGQVSAENLVIESNDAIYKIPHVEVSGSDLTEKDLTALFAADNPVPVAERLGRLSAASVTVPEIDVHLKGPQTIGDLAYHGVKLANVAKAHVEDGSIDGLNGSLSSSDSGPITIACGAGKTKDFDLAQNVRMMTETAKQDEAPQPLYSDLAIANCKFNVDKSQTIIDIEALHFVDVKGRPLAQPWKSAEQFFDPAAPGADDPETIEKRRAYLLDLYQAYRLGKMDADNLRITRKIDDATTSVSLAKFSVDNLTNAKFGEIRLDDLRIMAKDGTFKVGDISARGVDLNNLAKFLARKSSDPIAPSPLVDQFVVEGLDVDTIDRKSEASAHTRFQIGKFDLATAGDGGIPTRFAVALDHLTADLDGSKSAQLSELAGLGYSKLDLSSRLTIDFDARAQQLHVESLSLDGKDMGAINLSGQFSQVSEDLFSSDPTVAEAALLNALVNRVELKVENAGLFDKIIAANAKKEHKSADEIRRTYVAAVSVGVPAVLQNGPGAKLIAAALAKFIAAPKNLHVVAQAAQGLSASDFALVKQPGALMQHLEIQASANE